MESAHGLLERRSLVGAFPGDGIEIVHLAEVTVVGGLPVDGAQEIELLDDGGGLEAEHFADGLLDGFVADLAGAEGATPSTAR